MKKFTEGKWEVASDGCIDVDSETGLTYGIAEVMNFYTAEGEANARLIAAAPEMYSLLVYVAVNFPYNHNEKLIDKIGKILARIDGTEV